MKCRSCGAVVTENFVDLHNAPPSNSYLTKSQRNEPETYYPLSVFVCTQCWLVQIDEYKKSDEIFSSDYAYFSSFSSSWLAHAKRYSDLITDKLNLNTNSLVVEIASNDGYLLKNFVEKRIPCYGIEPTSGTAAAARKIGVETEELFFSRETADKLLQRSGKADLIIGNNVLAHVPDINSFVAGLRVLLKDDGTVTMEFPHLLNLIEQNQFDTIYHEHFSYLSLIAVIHVFEQNSLEIYDVEELPTHGGSLRIYAKQQENCAITISKNVSLLLQKENSFGLTDVNSYRNFPIQVEKLKVDFLSFLLEQKRTNKKVAAYGAAAKGNTLLNFCGVKSDLIEYVVDASPYKKNLYLPGSHIPIVDVSQIKETDPDFILIFPWNIADEIVQQLEFVRNWNCKFVTVIPQIRVW